MKTKLIAAIGICALGVAMASAQTFDKIPLNTTTYSQEDPLGR